MFVFSSTIGLMYTNNFILYRNMKKAELNPYRLNDTTHKSTIKSLNAVSMQSKLP